MCYPPVHENDLYTKVVLTFIAAMLTVIALKPLVVPGTVAYGQALGSSLQVSVGPPESSVYLYETGTGYMRVVGPTGTPIKRFQVDWVGR